MEHRADPGLERWIAHFRGPLVGLISSFGLPYGDAAELAQDVFAEAWIARARLADPDDLAAVGPWLRGIAWNLYCTRRRRQARGELPLDCEPAGGETEADDERLHLLGAAMAQLAPRQQALLRMRYLEDNPPREVALLLGLSEKAVEMRLYQARKALRAIVERLARSDRQRAQR